MCLPKNEIEDLSLSISKNCATFIEQTHTKRQRTVEIYLTQTKGSTFFTPVKNLSTGFNGGGPEGSLEGPTTLTILTSLELYNSVFNENGDNKQGTSCSKPKRYPQ